MARGPGHYLARWSPSLLRTQRITSTRLGWPRFSRRGLPRILGTRCPSLDGERMNTEVYRDEKGELHRPWQEGPALIEDDGSQAYYEHGKWHRPWQEGPAVVFRGGSQFYFEHGLEHRPWQEGPATVYPDGTQVYYEHGKRHRPVSDGPARIYKDGSSEYWENGVCVWKAHH